MANEQNLSLERGTEVPELNKTVLGLYVTPKKVYTMWGSTRRG